jgi:hypothetical protein
MKYFDQIDNINYYANQDQFKNIFQKLSLSSDIPENYITHHRLKENESLESLSFTLYGTVDFWWLLALINEVKDLFYDISLDNKVLKDTAKENISLIGKVITVKLSAINTLLETDTTGNYIYSEDGGKAEIVSWVDYSEKILTATVILGSFRLMDKIDINSTTEAYATERALVYDVSDTYFADDPEAYMVDFLTNYNAYETENDKLRVIKIIKPSFINKLILDIIEGT